MRRASPVQRAGLLERKNKRNQPGKPGWLASYKHALSLNKCVFFQTVQRC